VLFHSYGSKKEEKERKKEKAGNPADDDERYWVLMRLAWGIPYHQMVFLFNAASDGCDGIHARAVKPGRVDRQHPYETVTPPRESAWRRFSPAIPQFELESDPDPVDGGGGGVAGFG